MKKVKISIIVPIYKVEKYLNKCIDSVLCQTFTDFELILVDDGSPDSCPKICDDYAKKDSRVKVIHKPNGGLSDARNAGIEVAGGDYLAFIDSDDFVAPDTYEHAYNLMLEHNADMVVYDAVIVGETDDATFTDATKTFVMDKDLALKEMIVNRKFSVNAWNKLYKKELFSSLRYPKGMLYEDLALTYKLIDLCNTVVYTSAKKYAYVQRQSSIMGQTGYKMKKDKVLIVKEMIEYFIARENKFEICSGIASYLVNDVYKMASRGNLVSSNEYVSELKDCLKKYKKEMLGNPFVSFKDKKVLKLSVRHTKFLQFLYSKVRRG